MSEGLPFGLALRLKRFSSGSAENELDWFQLYHRNVNRVATYHTLATPTHPATADACVPGALTVVAGARVDVAADRWNEVVAAPGNDADADSSVDADAAQADTVANPMAAICHRHR